MPNFNLARDPSLSVKLHDGSISLISLQDLFANPEAYEDLNYDYPPSYIAWLRLCLAILTRSIALKMESESTGEKKTISSKPGAQFFAKKFPGELVLTYLAKQKKGFELFAPTRPFMQVQHLGAIEERPLYPWTRISSRHASGSEKLFHDHSKDNKPAWISAPDAATLLLTYNTFALGTLDQIWKVAASTGPAIDKPLSYLRGKNLAQTLLLNLVIKNGSASDLPCWERNAASDFLITPEQVTRTEIFTETPTGPCDLYTWMTRAIELVPELGSQGSIGVKWIRVAQGRAIVLSRHAKKDLASLPTGDLQIIDRRGDPMVAWAKHLPQANRGNAKAASKDATKIMESKTQGGHAGAGGGVDERSDAEKIAGAGISPPVVTPVELKKNYLEIRPAFNHGPLSHWRDLRCLLPAGGSAATDQHSEREFIRPDVMGVLDALMEMDDEGIDVSMGVILLSTQNRDCRPPIAQANRNEYFFDKSLLARDGQKLRIITQLLGLAENDGSKMYSFAKTVYSGRGAEKRKSGLSPLQSASAEASIRAVFDAFQGHLNQHISVLIERVRASTPTQKELSSIELWWNSARKSALREAWDSAMRHQQYSGEFLSEAMLALKNYPLLIKALGFSARPSGVTSLRNTDLLFFRRFGSLAASPEGSILLRTFTSSDEDPWKNSEAQKILNPILPSFNQRSHAGQWAWMAYFLYAKAHFVYGKPPVNEAEQPLLSVGSLARRLIGKQKDSIDPHKAFVSGLLSCQTPYDLCDSLSALLSYAGSRSAQNKLAINKKQMLYDVVNFFSPGDRVRQRWAADFFLPDD